METRFSIYLLLSILPTVQGTPLELSESHTDDIASASWRLMMQSELASLESIASYRPGIIVKLNYSVCQAIKLPRILLPPVEPSLACVILLNTYNPS
jgi:hypothetical protein